MRWKRSNHGGDPARPIVVPEKSRRRARQALTLGSSPSVWVDQCLFLVGQNVTHHRKGDHLLDEAIQSAEVLLALLTEMRSVEEEL